MPHKDRVNVFITGGTTGIGYSLAKLYQSKGHTVGVCGRDLSKINDDTLDSYAVDVTSVEQIKDAVQKVLRKKWLTKYYDRQRWNRHGPKRW